MSRPPLFNPTRWRDGWRIRVPAAFSPTGKRQAIMFESKSEAMDAQRQLLAALKAQGKAHPLFNPSASDRLIAELEPLAASVGMTIEEAVQATVLARKSSSSITLFALRDAFLPTLEGKSKQHIAAAKRITSEICEFFGDAVVDDMSLIAFEKWLNLYKSSPYNYNLHIAHAKSMFNWGKKRRLCSLVPSDAAKKQTISVEEITILTPEQAQGLFDSCRLLTPDAFLAWAVLLFTGVRPEELKRLTLNDFDLSERVLKVSASKSKTKSMRLIHIEDNLHEYLQSLDLTDKGKPITPVGWAKKHKKLRAACGVRAKDIARHSYASYHYGKYRDMGLLLDHLGHTTQQMTLKHYKTPPKPRHSRLRPRPAEPMEHHHRR